MKTTKTEFTVIPLMVPRTLHANIKGLSVKHGLPQAEIMRMSLKAGMPLLDKALLLLTGQVKKGEE